MTTNLERAATACADILSVGAQLRDRLAAVGSPGGTSDGDLPLAALVETARSLRRSSDDLFLFLASEALDRGVSPAVLDLPHDGPDPG